ncbi:unnamed protein product [Effrenium voratum]|uniref:Uncharacterized protein n=1 Tax=Effrenium voratum TaxID=2562239 RepID=A0AA36J8E8_9DINO|nr:unnamed protein product [Effrenium voratum]CAJ1417134.1 unnamed protein product [Effrenium voratum]CAJ1425294.1 unnamed protein product [Effrenium voratum]CAJ1426586.1 unnamed protein product [Effrenium voratum]CAJ1438130.1 unnamed protein product [Effrenium voratum]
MAAVNDGHKACTFCRRELPASELKDHGRRVLCPSCNTVETMLRRNLDGKPEHMPSVDDAESVKFFAHLAEQRQACGGRLNWTTVRAGLITAISDKIIESHTTAVGGVFKPKSVWERKGYTTQQIEESPHEWDPILGDTYAVMLKSVCRQTTVQNVTSAVLEHEKRATAKKNKKPKGGAPADEEALDLDLPLPPKAECNSTKSVTAEHKRQAQVAKKVASQNTKAAALAAKAVSCLHPVCAALEKSLACVAKRPSDASRSGLEQALTDSKAKLTCWLAACRDLLVQHEQEKPSQEPQALASLPFTADDLKPALACAREVLKSVKVSAPARKRAAPEQGDGPADVSAQPKRRRAK